MPGLAAILGHQQAARLLLLFCGDDAAVLGCEELHFLNYSDITETRPLLPGQTPICCRKQLAFGSRQPAVMHVQKEQISGPTTKGYRPRWSPEGAGICQETPGRSTVPGSKQLLRFASRTPARASYHPSVHRIEKAERPVAGARSPSE